MFAKLENKLARKKTIRTRLTFNFGFKLAASVYNEPIH